MHSPPPAPHHPQELFQLCNGHKNIVELIEFRDFGTEFYFVMEFCPSTLLDSVLEENKVREQLGTASSCPSVAVLIAWLHLLDSDL